MGSIIELPARLQGLKKEERELFDRFFSVYENTGTLIIPEEMKPWADKSFGSYKDVESQKIIKTFNKITYEGALFNELRAKRPMSAKADEDAQKAIKDSEGDPFCKPLTGTPSDNFGRITGKHCITASNVAKYDALHGLVIFRNHNPLQFQEKEIQDYFLTAQKWFSTAYKKNQEAKYPFMLWNCLWRSGASIIHGHMQMVLSQGTHYAGAEMLNDARTQYWEKFSQDYFTDLYLNHKAIGLAFETGKVKIFCSITPKKDKEITLIADKLDKKMVLAIYKAADTLTKEFGVESFNVGIIMPPMEPKTISLFKKKQPDAWSGFPVIGRIVDRGKLSNKTTDVAGMEMYSGTAVIETDPYRIIDSLQKRFSSVK